MQGVSHTYGRCQWRRDPSKYRLLYTLVVKKPQPLLPHVHVKSKAFRRRLFSEKEKAEKVHPMTTLKFRIMRAKIVMRNNLECETLSSQSGQQNNSTRRSNFKLDFLPAAAGQGQVLV